MRPTLALACTLLAATAAFAQQPMPRHDGFHPGAGGHGPGGPMDRSLIPPDVLLANQIALGLTDDQVAAIKKGVGETHDKVLDVQTSLQRVTEQLHAQLDATKIDEAGALALASQAMDLEKQIKTAHLGLLIRVKNLLTPDQQEKAKQLRPEHGPMPGGPGGMAPDGD